MVGPRPSQRQVSTMKDRDTESGRPRRQRQSVMPDRTGVVWHTRSLHKSGSLVATLRSFDPATTSDRGDRVTRYITTRPKSSVILLPPSTERRSETS